MKALAICGIVLSLGLSIGAAYAAPLTVVNPGFENFYTDSSMATPVTLNGYTYSIGKTGSTYCTNNGAANQSIYVPGWIAENGDPWSWECQIYTEGANHFMGMNKGWAVQNLGLSDTVKAGTYVLGMDIRIPTGASTDGRNWSLQADRNTYWSVLDNAVVSQSLVAGDWAHCTATYTVAADSANIGSGIMIVLNASSGSYMLDNVTVDFTPATAVPEPSSLLAFGSGIIGLCGLFRRRAIK